MNGAKDGSYYASGRSVLKRPKETDNGSGGVNVSMGFTVCHLADGVDHSGAEIIANALNEAQKKGLD